jgi:hypothetical protein
MTNPAAGAPTHPVPEHRPSEPTKRPYRPPRLETHGELVDLFAGSPGGTGESGNPTVFRSAI